MRQRMCAHAVTKRVAFRYLLRRGHALHATHARAQCEEAKYEVAREGVGGETDTKHMTYRMDDESQALQQPLNITLDPHARLRTAPICITPSSIATTTNTTSLIASCH